MLLQQVVCSGLVTMVNLQYQLSLACCESLGGLADCQCSPPHAEPDTHAVSRCYTRTPLPLLPQRRWSEACAGVEGRAPDNARRWSMPWKLSLPTGPGSDRSRSTTPGNIHLTICLSTQYMIGYPLKLLKAIV